MKRILITTIAGAVIVLTGAALAQQAISQPRVSTTRQLQVIGVAANNQSHGAWFVDLQANTVIFCERLKDATQCHTTGIP